MSTISSIDNQADSVIADDTLAGSKNVRTTKRTPRVVGMDTQLAQVSMTVEPALPAAIAAGQKRKFADITEEIEVVFSDGRRGIYKPSKYEVSYQIEWHC
jgi:hypothetical protein